jgi:hypothetical protein
MKELKTLENLKEYIESETRLGDLDYAHYNVIIDYIDVMIQGLEELNNSFTEETKRADDNYKLCKEILDELKNERGIKDYIVENILPSLKQKIKELNNRSCNSCEFCKEIFSGKFKINSIQY